jgi:hypothetical protein
MLIINDSRISDTTSPEVDSISFDFDDVKDETDTKDHTILSPTDKSVIAMDTVIYRSHLFHRMMLTESNQDLPTLATVV